MKDREFQVVCSAMDDCRRIIAAGKVQRWDVLKWGVTVNLALAAVSVSIDPHISLLILPVAVLVSIGSWSLISHYNERMAKARKTAVDLVEALKKGGVDYDGLLKTCTARDYSKGITYDKRELITFAIVLAVAPLLVLLRYLVGT